MECELYINSFHSVFKLAGKPEITTHNFDGKELLLSFTISKDFEEAKMILSSAKMKYFEKLDNILSISISKENFKIKVFLNEQFFLKDFSEIDRNNDFLILCYKDSFIVYNNNSSIQNQNGRIDDDFFVYNTLNYMEFLNQLKRNADYVNTANNEIIYYTSTKGIFKLKYPQIKPHLSKDKNLESIFNDFLERFKQKDFTIFLKNEFFDTVTSNQIIELIDKLPMIISSADRNYELFTKNFNWDTFNSKLKFEKDRYFNSFRDILGKIMSQIIILPISVTATFIAINSITNLIVLNCIYLSYIIYSIVIIAIEYSYYKDLRELESDFIKDYNILLKDSGLNEAEIIFEKQKINARLNRAKILVVVFISSMFIFLGIISLFIFCKLSILNIYYIFVAFLIHLIN